MTGPEFPDYTESEFTMQAVHNLKTATPWLGPHMVWESADGAFQYVASAIKLPEEPDIPEGMDLKDVPVWLWREIMRAWDVLSISLRPDINDEVKITSYRIGAGHPMYVSEMQFEAAELDNLPLLLESITLEQQTRMQFGLTEPDLRHYANLDNALFDLDTRQSQAMEEHIQRRQTMTKDELRWERMQKYKWLLGEVVDKTSEPRWWGFTEGSMVHAVYASSPDEAAVMLEEHHKHDLFPIFFADPYPDDTQPVFQAKFEGRGVVRLIPFSSVEWPKDHENMTDEQRMAFDRLN